VEQPWPRACLSWFGWKKKRLGRNTTYSSCKVRFDTSAGPPLSPPIAAPYAAKCFVRLHTFPFARYVSGLPTPCNPRTDATPRAPATVGFSPKPSCSRPKRGSCIMLRTGANTVSTPVACASAAMTALIIVTRVLFHDMAVVMGSGKMVPPLAPPCNPSLTKLVT
jgi:hypothetical protein